MENRQEKGINPMYPSMCKATMVAAALVTSASATFYDAGAALVPGDPANGTVKTFPVRGRMSLDTTAGTGGERPGIVVPPGFYRVDVSAVLGDLGGGSPLVGEAELVVVRRELAADGATITKVLQMSSGALKTAAAPAGQAVIGTIEAAAARWVDSCIVEIPAGTSTYSIQLIGRSISAADGVGVKLATMIVTKNANDYEGRTL